MVKFPLTANRLRDLGEAEVAVLDQFTGRYAKKLQEGLGTKLLPGVLELTKEQGELDAYLNKLNRLEKIGALPSVEEWLELRQMRNAFELAPGSTAMDSGMHPVRGFTLVELITIIVILGILAVAVAPRFFDRNVFDSRGFYDQVISTVRYAQKTAIAQRRFVCVTFPANNQISLAFGDTNACTGGALLRPSGEAYPLTNNNATFAPLPSDFSFDCLGRPRDVVTLATCGSAAGILIAPTIITVNGYSPDVTVEQETGYVH